MTETREIKIKRLKMRSMRRGIKEMDLILSAFSERTLNDLSDEGLTLYDALLSENDHDIFAWILGTQSTPIEYSALMEQISGMAEGLVKPV